MDRYYEYTDRLNTPIEAFTHQSCKEYIEFVRINRVTDLLLFTNLDLTYISQETGFSDCSNLIRTFRKWKGCTPRQWMREYNSELQQ